MNASLIVAGCLRLNMYSKTCAGPFSNDLLVGSSIKLDPRGPHDKPAWDRVPRQGDTLFLQHLQGPGRADDKLI